MNLKSRRILHALIWKPEITLSSYSPIKRWEGILQGQYLWFNSEPLLNRYNPSSFLSLPSLPAWVSVVCRFKWWAAAEWINFCVWHFQNKPTFWLINAFYCIFGDTPEILLIWFIVFFWNRSKNPNFWRINAFYRTFLPINSLKYIPLLVILLLLMPPFLSLLPMLLLLSMLFL